jgi:hypothetical protein
VVVEHVERRIELVEMTSEPRVRCHVSYKSSYNDAMSETITVRPDEATRLAIAELTADGTKVSEAVRTALIEAAARHAKQRLRDEVAAVAADPEDRREAAQILRDMELLSAR